MIVRPVFGRSMRAILVCTMLVMTLIGCTRTETDGAAPQPEPSGQQASGDFSTPRSAVETFIAAAAARDVDLLSQSVAENATGEFAELRNKTAGQEDVDGLARLLQGAEITDVKVDEADGTAVAMVKLSERDEEIQLTRTEAGWKILDF